MSTRLDPTTESTDDTNVYIVPSNRLEWLIILSATLGSGVIVWACFSYLPLLVTVGLATFALLFVLTVLLSSIIAQALGIDKFRWMQ